MRTLMILGVTAFSVMAAESLQERALKAGLKPIPLTQKAQRELVKNPENPLTESKILLGKMLYFDPRLSKSGLISCNTCHNLGMGGADGVSAAIGHKWTANPHHLNSPTVYNAALHEQQMWDGRFRDVEEQAGGPVVAEPEMAATHELVTSRLETMEGYRMAFKEAFGEEGITFVNVRYAIGAFERTLLTPSRFDKFLLGDEKALSAQEKQGLKLFLDKGCVSCHTGHNIGDGAMQPFPVAGAYKYDKVGDFKGDANGLVKVPTLRNIEETAPYMHNGAVWNLKEAVEIMAETQLGMELSSQESEDIVVFMKSLTGRKPTITYPILPPSTPTTPKPELY